MERSENRQLDLNFILAAIKDDGESLSDITVKTIADLLANDNYAISQVVLCLHSNKISFDKNKALFEELINHLSESNPKYARITEKLVDLGLSTDHIEQIVTKNTRKDAFTLETILNIRNKVVHRDLELTILLEKRAIDMLSKFAVGDKNTILSESQAKLIRS